MLPSAWYRVVGQAELTLEIVGVRAELAGVAHRLIELHGRARGAERALRFGGQRVRVQLAAGRVIRTAWLGAIWLQKVVISRPSNPVASSMPDAWQ